MKIAGSVAKALKRTATTLLLMAIFAAAPCMAGKVIFDMVDPKDDDKGPGYYEYPIDTVFNDGAFDLRRFRVVDEGRYVELVFTFEGEIRRSWQIGGDLWTEDNNWILQTMDVYIDTDGVAGSGFVRSIPGRNIVFKIDSAWEKVILASPKRRERVIEKIKNMSEDLEFSAMHTAVVVPTFYRVKRYEIIARVDKRELGEPQPWWGWQVLVLGNDSRETSNSFYNREVVSFKTNDKFGGGSDYSGDPNVIDLLSESVSQQREWLSGYRSVPDPSNCRYAVIGSNYREKKPASKAFDMPRKDYGKVLEDLMTRAVSGTSAAPKAPASQRAAPVPAPVPTDPGDAPESVDRYASRRKTGPIDTEISSEDPDFSGSSSGAPASAAPVEAAQETMASTDSVGDACRAQMTKVLEASMDYHSKHPDDGNITLLDLIYDGYFSDRVSCPGGGKYAIYGEEEGKIKVRCFNPSGVEHGSIP